MLGENLKNTKEKRVCLLGCHLDKEGHGLYASCAEYNTLNSDFQHLFFDIFLFSFPLCPWYRTSLSLREPTSTNKQLRCALCSRTFTIIQVGARIPSDRPRPKIMATTALPTIQERLRRTSKRQRIGLALLTLVVVAFVVVFFSFERQIFQILEPAVDYIRTSNAGIIVLAAIMGATCIFPLFGYGVVSMVCGYVYGIPKGFIPAFVGDVVGASACFWLYRLAFQNYFSRKFNDNLEFKEMSKAVSKDGIFILFLIRLSSFPFAVLNAYFGAMTQLPYWKFILATTLSTPHLFLPIFIGHNISSLADPDITGKDRILKWVGNILGIIFTLAAAWYIYRHTTRRIQRINAGLAAEDGEEEDELEAAARAMHQQQQRPRQQYSLPPYDSSMDLTNERQWDKNERESTYDTAVSMEELESLRRRGSGEGQSAETIAVVDDLGDADRRKNRL